MPNFALRYLTGVFAAILMLCGLSSLARAEPYFIPLDGSGNFKPNDFGYKITTSVANERVVVQIDLSAKAAKAFRGGTLTLKKAGREVVTTNVGLVGLHGSEKEPGLRLVLDPQAVDDGELEIGSEYIEGAPLLRNFAGFSLNIAKILKKAAAPEQAKTVERLKAVVETSVTKVHPNEPFKVTFRVENPTKETQTIRIMSCSWNDNWKSDNPAVSLGAWPCGDNADISVTIEPGKAYKFSRNEQDAELTVAPNTSPGKLTFRMGFTNYIIPKVGAKQDTHTFWSEPIVLEVLAGEGERANPPPPRPDPETPGMRKGALFENPKALSATPDELRKTYAAFVTAIQLGAAPTEFLLPSAVSVSQEPRPEKTAEYGQDINLPFLKKGFSPAVQLVRKDADDCYLIRTASTAIWFVETKAGKWKIYHYLDKPIE